MPQALVCTSGMCQGYLVGDRFDHSVRGLRFEPDHHRTCMLTAVAVTVGVAVGGSGAGGGVCGGDSGDNGDSCDVAMMLVAVEVPLVVVTAAAAAAAAVVVAANTAAAAAVVWLVTDLSITMCCTGAMFECVGGPKGMRRELLSTVGLSL